MSHVRSDAVHPNFSSQLGLLGSVNSHMRNAHALIYCQQQSGAVQVGRKEVQGKFAQQLQLTLRANMDGLKKRVKTKPSAKVKSNAS